LVTAHVGPDGDTLGSMLGLKHALVAYYPHIERFDCVISGKMPHIYRFMPGIETVKAIETSADQLIEDYDLAVSVDCGSLGRLGPAAYYFNKAKITANIDHHISNDAFAQLNILETDAAASGQVIANILNDWQVPIHSEAATCLYVALLTDTGGFRHSGTTPEVFTLAAQLQRAGVNVTEAYKYVFEDQPRSQTLLQAQAVLQSQLAEEGQLIWTTVPLSMLTQFGAIEEQVEGLIDCLRHTEGTLIAAVIREAVSGETKISLRSNTDAIDVSALLAKAFNGGGHKKAAGAGVNKPLAEVEAQLLPLLRQAIQQAKAFA
jgi:bifunctional oligoribonuclease and PAP phosphatase NrnA